jgi:hypothetical protein
MHGTSAVVRGNAAGTRCVERVHVGVNSGARAGEGSAGRCVGVDGYKTGRSVRGGDAEAGEIGGVVGRGNEDIGRVCAARA